MLKCLGEELGLPLSDAYTPVWEEMQCLREEKEGRLCTDGLHLTAGAYRFAVEAVKDVIKTSYPEKSWDAIPLLFPQRPLGLNVSTTDKAVALAGTDPF
ncbi:isoamyl acetate-hydrolyzing esterase [Rhodotorula kratochvilovae]